MRVVGIDPGYKGALCFYIDGKVYMHDMPVVKTKKAKVYNIVKIRDIINKYKPEMGVVEKINPSYGTKNGKTSAVSDAKLYGCYMMLRGVLIGLDCVCVEVSPQTWKKKFNLIGAGKDASISLVDDIEIKRNDEADARLLCKYCEELYKKNVK